ncbi:MAG: hypothetical protein L0227_15935, partial [Chloroflexi bacterium]|nr:hypothetical protein [Chloroflexota bacterium]
MSPDGLVVVGESSGSSGFEAFRWTEATGMFGLGDLPGGLFGAAALGATNQGAVIVGASYGEHGLEAFRWTEAMGMVGLGDLPGGGFLSRAYGASADGSIVVGEARRADGSAAFIWDARHGMRSLQDVLVYVHGVEGVEGWMLGEARGVSADGTVIVGIGYSDSRHAWRAVLPPRCTVCPADEVARLGAADAAPGDAFGTSVSLSRSRAVVGAPASDGGASNAGSAYVYRSRASVWSVGPLWREEAKILAPNPSANDGFGSSVAISGGLVLIGAPFADGAGYGSGAAYGYRLE